MAAQTGDHSALRGWSPAQWLGLVFTYLLLPLILFLCAWDLAWWQAWSFTPLIFAVGIIGRAMAEKRHPGLLVERVKSPTASGVKSWDKVLSPLMAVSISFPLVIVAGLDHRFGWSPTFSVWLNILGLVMIAAGYTFADWALVENRFFSGMVRIQTDRGHSVCDTGPYRYIRHPGYAGNILALFGIVLALSSLWTIIPAAVALTIAVTRTALEDRTLQAELPGYLEYTRRVRYRLLPGVF